MTTAPTVQEALESLRAALEAEARQTLQNRLGEILEPRASLNGHSPVPASKPARRSYRMSKAGRARIEASAKARWKAYRAAKARAK